MAREAWYSLPRNEGMEDIPFGFEKPGRWVKSTLPSLSTIDGDHSPKKGA